MGEQQLAVWCLDGVYKVVAYSNEDAFAAYVESTGDGSLDERLPDDRVLTIIDDVEVPPEKRTTTTKTCGEWAASNGRGFLCSTEW